ncbi:response regulator [Pseudoalteromonas luteoviolacea]|uniref:Response regulator n=1 Tax=Pseudoalteromonas luteoviolacea NCIMB 1942 TaxID=1365253 RepID=A0A167G8M1_9GAMM|nr:response regulator [Pseudoalteromonas luteoviolacea]KZN54318.1 response regulator [Pseudoalteromonas luteoviolacea NCIMB 1942]KZX01051.1 response regulator [Pseudoalteromonas luteoviolacea]
MKVLIVDDSHATCEIIRRALQQFEYRKLFVSCASRVDDALALVKDWQPNIVLTDWQMPEKTGIELLQAVVDEHPEIPVGMISTIDDEEQIAYAKSFGCAFFLSKPFTDDELLHAIKPLILELEAQEFITEQEVPLKDGLALPKTDALERLMQKNISDCLTLKPIRSQVLDESKLPCVMVVYAERGSQKVRVIGVLDVYAACVLASSVKIIPNEEALQAIHMNQINEEIMSACEEALSKTAYAFLDNQSKMSLYVRSCKCVYSIHPKLELLYKYPLDSRMDLSCEREGMAQGKMLIVGV